MRPALRLALAPAGDHGLGAAGGVVPERAPPSGEDNGQSDQDQRPAAPGWFFVHGTCEAAECGVSKMSGCPVFTPPCPALLRPPPRPDSEPLPMGHDAWTPISIMRADDLWVFGYGSLIWRPGFDYLERVPARIDRAAPLAVRLFVRASRHAGTAGPGARPRSRRRLPRHRLPGRGGEARRRPLAYLRDARAGDLGVSRSWCAGVARGQARAARRSALLHGRPQPSAIRRPAHARAAAAPSCARATAAPATTATM